MANSTANESQQAFTKNSTAQEGIECFVSGMSKTLQADLLYYSNFVLTPVMILLGIWCFLSNGSVLLAVHMARFQCRAGFLLLCSLTLTDFLWGGVVAPMYVTFRVREFLRGEACANREDWNHPVMVISFFLCLFGTVGNLAVISIDRYLAVANAMWYKVSMKRRRAFVSCFFVWLASTSIVSLKQANVVSEKWVETAEACYVGLTSAAIIVIQLLTLRYLYKHNNNVAQMNANSANAVNAAIERKLTITTTYVVGLLALVLIPCAVLIAVSKLFRVPSTIFIEPVYFPLATLCSGINPVLYYRGNAQIRDCIMKLLKCQ